LSCEAQLLRQTNALQFAGGAFGDFFQKYDAPRYLEVGDARPDKGAQFPLIAGGAFAQQHTGRCDHCGVVQSVQKVERTEKAKGLGGTPITRLNIAAKAVGLS
jgi:hypothetical protein